MLLDVIFVAFIWLIINNFITLQKITDGAV